MACYSFYLVSKYRNVMTLSQIFFCKIQLLSNLKTEIFKTWHTFKLEIKMQLLANWLIMQMS